LIFFFFFSSVWCAFGQVNRRVLCVFVLIAASREKPQPAAIVARPAGQLSRRIAPAAAQIAPAVALDRPCSHIPCRAQISHSNRPSPCSAIASPTSRQIARSSRRLTPARLHPCRLPSRSPARPDVRPRARPCRVARRVRIARQRPCARAVPLAYRVPSVRAHNRAPAPIRARRRAQRRASAQPAPSPAVPACQQLQVRVAVPRECPELILLFYCFFRRFRC